ncbi:MAG: phenylalanine--tRNA ligase subunit beta [Patescibacteria group bacterium]
MKAPLSWLKEYVDIKLTPEKLGERLTEVGLGCEKIEKTKDDVIFDLEITPNRPDCLSIIGIAREIAAIEEGKIKLPKVLKNIENVKPAKTLPLKITTSSEINPRFTGIIINGIKVGKSPTWLVEKLEKVGQRSINNIVDITNYVMLEIGNPIHAFDYDKIKGATMKVHLTHGGEKFTSVDGISYHLPKNAVVISDNEKIIDLCGIKGGENSGTYENTKTIFLRVPIEISNLIRRASQSLGLRSEASSIFERGVNAGGAVEALSRTVELILEIAGGEIASPLYDIKKEDFKPWKVNLNLERLNKILGIEIPEQEVKNLLERLNLLNKKVSNNKLEVTIPTYRNDLKIEEDIIEEVARLYGYNNFPKTLPIGQIPTNTIPYFKDYKLEEKIKNTLKTGGFSEIYTYSLVSESDLQDCEINPDRALRVDNPVSREFEYLRPTLKINLRKALLQNASNFEKVNLFEIGKVYLGKNLDEAKEEYRISGISSNKTFYEVKGILERILEDLGIKEDISEYIKVIDEGVFFEINYNELIKNTKPKKKFKPVAKYPPITEDLTLVINENIKVGNIIENIKIQSNLIKEVEVIDKFEDNVTLHIVYQNDKGNLMKEDAEKIRVKILKSLSEKFKIKLQD